MKWRNSSRNSGKASPCFGKWRIHEGWEASTRKTDVRLIAATNKDLHQMVSNGEFRQDLYFRLKTVTVDIPLLRKRIQDLSAFVERFSLDLLDQMIFGIEGLLLKQFD